MSTSYDELFRSILAMDAYNRNDHGMALQGAIGDATLATFLSPKPFQRHKLGSQELTVLESPQWSPPLMVNGHAFTLLPIRTRLSIPIDAAYAQALQ